MSRTTRKQIEGIFELFVKDMGGHIATRYADDGGYFLDHNAVYGGYVIGQYRQLVGWENGAEVTRIGEARAQEVAAPRRCALCPLVLPGGYAYDRAARRYG